MPALAPDLTIVIVSWNTRDYLERCLESLLSSSAESAEAAPSHEICVVDNGSSDGSAAMVAHEHSEVRLIRNDENRGFSAANNQAAALAHGRYLLLLNSDTEVHPGALSSMVACLDADSTIGIVGARLVNTDGSLQPSCSRAPSPWRDAVHLAHLDRRLRGLQYPMEHWGTERARDVDTVMGAALMIRYEAWKAVGGLDEGYFMYSEEVELCEKVRSAGWRVCWLPTAVVTHHGGASARQAPDVMFEALFASKARFYRRNRSLIALALFKLVLLFAALPRLLAGLLAPLVPGARGRLWASRGRQYAGLVRRLPCL